MLTFYYSKGSSALGVHILLHEVQADYDVVEIPIPSGAHQSAEFLQTNPKGRIPALRTPDGVLTENPAILEYIATLYPDALCLPVGAFEQAKARAFCAYLCATAHVAFAHFNRGTRWAEQETSLNDMKSLAPKNLRDCAHFLETDLTLTPWAMGDRYSFCDPYLFVFGRWLSMGGVDIHDYPKLAAHRTRMLSRPATQTVLALHGL